MPVQTNESNGGLVQGDFAHTTTTTQGVAKWGLKLRYMGSPAKLDVLLIQYVSAWGTWESNLLLSDQEAKLKTSGAVAYLRDVLIPAVNKWLAEAFGGTTELPPAVDVGDVPALIAELDKLVCALKATDTGGTKVYQ